MHAHPFGKIKVSNASADRQVERERDMCLCSFLISSVCSTLGTRLCISKFSKFFAKNSDHTRCLAVSILE